jgi:hypothetical protein
VKSILSVKLNLQPAWLWWIDFQRRCLCHLCRLFWLPNSQRWSQHVQFTGCHGNCLHTSDASGDWLHVFIFIAFCSASTPNLLETVWSEAQKSMFLSSTCGHANDYEELHFLYWVSFHSSGVFYSCRIIHFCCHDVAASRCHSDLEQWGSRQHFESLFVGVPCCFSSSGCLIIYEIWIYYRFMMIYDVSRCIVMFLLGISSHAAKKYQTCVFDSLNGLFFSGKSTGNRSF